PNAPGDTGQTVTTDSDTVVLLADFYRAGDGIHESFADVPMFVSNQDERPDLPGDQNVWISGVGWGGGFGNFNGGFAFDSPHPVAAQEAGESQFSISRDVKG